MFCWLCTGETGAGKSILIDSIGFLLGRRGGRDLLRSGTDRATVSALFSSIDPATAGRLAEIGIEPDEGGEVLIERSLTAEGRTTARANGRPVNLSMLKSVGDLLVNIHGQSDTHTLTEKKNQLSILDGYAGNEALNAEYSAVYGQLSSVRNAINQAFVIWLLRGTFSSISSEMEQAAKIDGCGTVQALVRILLPTAAPGIVTTLIFVFINSWNEYTIALTLISSDIFKPITVGINVFYGFNIIKWQYLFATSIFATIPVIILFLCIEKHLVSGLTAGGVKG